MKPRRRALRSDLHAAELLDTYRDRAVLPFGSEKGIMPTDDN
jgi:hypothetical protein